MMTLPITPPDDTGIYCEGCEKLDQWRCLDCKKTFDEPHIFSGEYGIERICPKCDSAAITDGCGITPANCRRNAKLEGQVARKEDHDE